MNKKTYDTFRYSHWEERTLEELQDFMKVNAVKWAPRARKMAQVIQRFPEITDVLDFGCGLMGLRDFLPNQKYYGYDAIQYTPEVLVVDLKTDFPGVLPGNPAQRAIVFLGLLEWLPTIRCQEVLAWANQNSGHVFGTYFVDDNRPEWANNLTKQQFLSILSKLGPSYTEGLPKGQLLFHITGKQQ